MAENTLLLDVLKYWSTFIMETVWDSLNLTNWVLWWGVFKCDCDLDVLLLCWPLFIWMKKVTKNQSKSALLRYLGLDSSLINLSLSSLSYIHLAYETGISWRPLYTFAECLSFFWPIYISFHLFFICFIYLFNKKKVLHFISVYFFNYASLSLRGAVLSWHCIYTLGLVKLLHSP